MKLQLSIACACLFAFCNAAPEAVAQGKIRFGNDSLHLVYFWPEPWRLLPTDQQYAGQMLPVGGVTPSGVTLRAELWGGTSSSSLSNLATATFWAAPGCWEGGNLDTPLAGGITAFFQVLVYDAAAGSYANAINRPYCYCGQSAIFTAVTGAGSVYNSIVNPTTPAYSTWAPGDWNLDDSAWGVGARGAIAIGTFIPEPGSTALLSLGVAGLMLTRWHGRSRRLAMRAW